MEAITVEMVCQAAAKILDELRRVCCAHQEEKKLSVTFFSAAGFLVDSAYKNGLEKLGLTSVDSVFAFRAGKNLTKDNLALHRSRVEFKVESPAVTVFLKRYDRPPITVQIKNWLSAKKRVSCGFAEYEAARNLAKMGINTPQVIAFGQQCGMLFEKRSFVIMEKVPHGESLERRLPEFFDGQATPENLKMRRQFIIDLATFVRKFHETGYRHRDLYFCHIFRTADGQFYLIDLARAFKPMLFDARYRVKDLAQLNYSVPVRYFSRTDRMRFYIAYTGRPKLASQDKTFVKKIIQKTGRIARHDLKRAGYRAAQ
jgi:tRNA A-37 threonylcarbamoyl transferase component Bud32